MNGTTIAQNIPRVFAAAALALTVSVVIGQTERIEVVIEDRAVVKPADRLIRITEGDVVELIFRSDEAGELHLHGYDVRVALDPASPRTVTIDARATGRYPFTSHGFGAAAGRSHGHGALLFLEVHPR